MPTAPMKTLFSVLVLALAPLAVSAQAVPRWAAPVSQGDDPRPLDERSRSLPLTRSGPVGGPGLPGGNNPNAPGGSGGTHVPAGSVPVDGGLAWLALAGGAYAVRRLRRQEDGPGFDG